MLRPVEWLLRVVTTICVLVYVLGLIFGVVTGRVKMRDERGRLRPVPAALLAVLSLFLLGLMLSAVFE